MDLSKAFNVGEQVADPEGTNLKGTAPGYDLAAGAIGRPQLIYISRDNSKEVLLEADVFIDHVHLHCAVCKLRKGDEHGLMINKGVKQWGFDPNRQVTFPGWEPARMMAEFPRGSGGELSCEKFKCPWCATTMAIDKNVVKLA